MEDCIFCKITAGGKTSKKIDEDGNFFSFFDIFPLAPVHRFGFFQKKV